MCVLVDAVRAQDFSRDPDVVAQELAAISGPARLPLLLELTDALIDDSERHAAWVKEAMSWLGEEPEPYLFARALNGRSWSRQMAADYELALSDARRAEALLDAEEHPLIVARSLYLSGVAAWRLSRHREAQIAASHAQAIQVDLAQDAELARTLRLLGAAHRSLGEFDQALEAHLESLRISEEIGDRSAVGKAHNNIGLIYWKIRRFEDARRSFEQSLEIMRDDGATRVVATMRSNLGLILVELGKPEEAVGHLTAALQMQRQFGNRAGEAKVLGNLGFVCDKLKKHDESLDYYREALAIREEVGDKNGIVRSKGSIAGHLQRKEKHREALAMLAETLELAESIGALPEQVDLHWSMMKSYDALGDDAAAYEAYRRCKELKAMLQAGADKTEEIVKEKERAERQQRLADDEARLSAARRELVIWGSLLTVGLILAIGMYISRSRALRAVRASHADLQRATARLAESEQRYRMLFETAVVPTLLIDDATQKVVDLNEPARGLCGDLPEHGLPVENLQPPWVCECIGRLLESDPSDDLAMDDCWVEPSGRLRWTEMRGSRVLVDGREAKLVSVRDTTEMRSHEEARLRADKLESLGVLAGGIAHDFNNALTVILGHVGLARTGCQPDELDEELQLAEQSAMQARHLTSQLLSFAKGGLPVRRVQDVAKLLREDIALAGSGSSMAIDLEIEADLWSSELDRGQFTQVVSNLVINAQQAAVQAGRLSVRAQNFCGDPETNEPGGQDRFVRIEFEDNGAGIPVEAREHIFDPYFTTKDSGNGLGLATVFAIVRKHGGTVTFESSEGRGTTFRVFFPASLDEAVSRPARDDTAVPRAGSVLVLEDEPLVQRVYRRWLKNWGYDVEVASEGERAVQLYRQRHAVGQPFDLLIMDLTIPGGVGGRDALVRIHEIDPHARAIVASGYTDDPTLANFQQAGFVAALAKPFRHEDFARVLGEVMRAGRESRSSPAQRAPGADR